MRARREILRVRTRMRVDVAQEPRNVNNRNALRTLACHVDPRLVRCDRYSKRPYRKALQFIQRNFHWLTHVRTKYRQRVRERPTVFQVRQGYQVLRMKLGHDTKSPVGRECHMKP